MIAEAWRFVVGGLVMYMILEIAARNKGWRERRALVRDGNRLHALLPRVREIKDEVAACDYDMAKAPMETLTAAIRLARRLKKLGVRFPKGEPGWILLFHWADEKEIAAARILTRERTDHFGDTPLT